MMNVVTLTERQIDKQMDQLLNSTFKLIVLMDICLNHIKITLCKMALLRMLLSTITMTRKQNSMWWSTHLPVCEYVCSSVCLSESNNFEWRHDIQHNGSHFWKSWVKCHSAKFLLLNVILPKVSLLNVILINISLLNVILLIIILLNISLLNVILLNFSSKY
jgi:hypothetical protein